MEIAFVTFTDKFDAIESWNDKVIQEKANKELEYVNDLVFTKHFGEGKFVIEPYEYIPARRNIVFINGYSHMIVGTVFLTKLL